MILQGKTSKKEILQEALSDKSIGLPFSTIESSYNIEDDGFNDSNADTDVLEGRFIIAMVYGCGKQSSCNYSAKVFKKKKVVMKWSFTKGKSLPIDL